MLSNIRCSSGEVCPSGHFAPHIYSLIANLLLMVMQKRIRRTWSFSNLATMFRIMLMYYVNSYTFFEEPEKDWAKILENLQLQPPELTLFD